MKLLANICLKLYLVPLQDLLKQKKIICLKAQLIFTTTERVFILGGILKQLLQEITTKKIGYTKQ